jgi:hypothetical protein
MTNPPGDDQQPQDPNQPTSPYGEQQPGYWQQQSQPPPYPQQPGQQPGQPPYPQQGQPPYPQQPYYGQPQGYPPAAAPDHPKATTALVLGILGVVVCGILAPFAWRMGKQTVTEIDASNGQLGGRGSAQAGYILGIIGSVLLGLALLVLVFYVIVIVIAIGSSATT